MNSEPDIIGEIKALEQEKEKLEKELEQLEQQRQLRKMKNQEFVNSILAESDEKPLSFEDELKQLEQEKALENQLFSLMDSQEGSVNTSNQPQVSEVTEKDSRTLEQKQGYENYKTPTPYQVLSASKNTTETRKTPTISEEEKISEDLSQMAFWNVQPQL